KQGLTLLGVVPQDEQVFEFDCDGVPTVKLPEDSPVRKALYDIMGQLDLS
ncbi:MAG: carbon monoxide dehydrogenase, partial [Lachnospiraceae bacterium]|nr:carbon monoxide dehydrogenase [Lachnospiraceae bacterium]